MGASRRPTVAAALVAALVAALAAVAATVGYRRWVGPWQRRWGATDDEVDGRLPGDERVVEPAEQVTRAVSIEAPPEAVWPWVVQLGADRGGFYSYDWLENLFGLGIHSADRIVPDWQHLAVGDLVAATRSAVGGWYVVDLEPGRSVVLAVADVRAGRPVRRDEQLGWEFQWTFVLRRRADGGTRLLVRERTGFTRPLLRTAMAPVGLVSFVMTRRMLLGIKERAERPPT